MKALLNLRTGYGGKPRLPLPAISKEKAEEILSEPFMKDLLDLEASL